MKTSASSLFKIGISGTIASAALWLTGCGPKLVPLETMEVTKPLVNPGETVGFSQLDAIIVGAFFLIDLILFCYCKHRVNKLMKEDLPAKKKLALWESLDAWMDIPLYIGLLGTVVGFLLIACNIQQASRMVAYISTVFGIITSAIIKLVATSNKEKLLRETKDNE